MLMKNLVYNFDWDDNVMFMKTKIWYFHKNPEKAKAKGLPLEIPISTETFRHTRKKVGVKTSYGYYKVSRSKISETTKDDSKAVKINYKDYEIVDPGRDSSLTCGRNSFREFRDGDEVNYFLEDLKYSLKNKLYGPCWDKFVKCLSNKTTAAKMTIITARGHSPKAMYEGLKYLKAQGYIKYLPLMRHVFPVSYQGLDKKYVGSADNPSEAKKNVIINSLDIYQEEAADCPKNQPREFGFSDDDHNTIETIKESLIPLVEEGRWPNLKIALYFTGNKEEEEIVLQEAVSA